VDFKTAINKIMNDVKDGSTEPFIVYRDQSGGWHCDHTKNQFGNTFDWVEDVKDPFAIIYTGKDFSNGSFPSVYDTMLFDRLRAEYYDEQSSDAYSENLNALTCLFYDRAGEFSSEITDYLTTLERPLAALAEMCPLDITSDIQGDWGYDVELASDAINFIEKAVKDRLHTHVDKPAPEKQGHDGYTELNKISVNDSDVILAENPNAEYRYMVIENRYTSYYNESGNNNIYTGHTNDYIEAIREFTEKVLHNVNCVQSRRDMRKSMDGIDYVELKNDDCLPGSGDAIFTGKLIIVKASELKPEYRTADSQLVLCTHGNGARPNAKGTSVFCKELFSGESVCYGRHQIAGIADPDKLPHWAKAKFAEHEAKQPQQKEKTADKKPSLMDRLDDAKVEAAAHNAEQKGAPKSRNRGAVEVE
jgi:hypothetical protein